MDELYIAAAVSLILILALNLFSKRPSSKLPPGPWGLPVIGYLPFLRHDLHRQFTQLTVKYGPIYMFSLGSKQCIVIGSSSILKEVVRDKDAIFANRDVPIAAQVASHGGNDIAWSPLSSSWRSMRKIFVHEIQSSKSLESSYNLRKDEVRNAIRYIYTQTGKPIEIGKLAFELQLNVINNILWGDVGKGEEGERVRSEFQRGVQKLVDLCGKANVSDFFPFLAALDIQGIKKDSENHLQLVDNIIDKFVAQSKLERSSEVDHTKEDRNKTFLHTLLELQERNQDSEMPITHEKMNGMLLDTVVGATDTMSTTIEWVMAELMNNPTIMLQVQKELCDVVGMNTLVEEYHMPKLQYLKVVIKETMRLHPAVPLLIPRSPSQSTTIGGYTIPKNATTFINVWAIQRDPSNWENPDIFKPERFLNVETEKFDFYGTNLNYLPLGSGRRVCAGVALAELMLVYIIGSLLHSYEWKLPEGGELDMTERFGMVLRKSTPLFAIPSTRLSDFKLYK